MSFCRLWGLMGYKHQGQADITRINSTSARTARHIANIAATLQVQCCNVSLSPGSHLPTIIAHHSNLLNDMISACRHAGLICYVPCPSGVGAVVCCGGAQRSAAAQRAQHVHQ